MAKKPAVVVTSKKNSMVRVKCPKRGNVEVWANVGPKKGPVCTACNSTGHDIVK